MINGARSENEIIVYIDYDKLGEIWGALASTKVPYFRVIARHATFATKQLLLSGLIASLF